MELASICVILLITSHTFTPILAIQAPSNVEDQASSIVSQESTIQLRTSSSLVESKGRTTMHAKSNQSQVGFFQECDGFRIKACSHATKTGEETLSCFCGIGLWKWFLGLPLLSALVASICLLIAIGYLQSSPALLAQDRDHTGPEDCDPARLLEYRLNEVKWQGLLRRLKVSAPVLICGFSIIGFAIPTALTYPGVSLLFWFSMPSAIAGFTVVTAALLPTDTKTIRTTCVLMISFLLFLVKSTIPRLMLMMSPDSEYGRTYAKHNIMTYKYFKIFLLCTDCTLCPTLACYLVYHLWFSPMRVVLGCMWKTNGYYALNWAMGMSSMLTWAALDSRVDRSWDDGDPMLRISCIYVIVVTGINTYVCLSPHLRHAIRDALTADSQEAATAAGVANMICHMDPLEVLTLAQSTFTCVPADRLTREDMAENTPNPRLRALAEPAKFGCVDAFMSHSWSDNAEAKWNTLQAWRQSFKDLHGEEPKLWIDKYCIDQSNISESLACLPVYLSGCKKLLVLSGDTYLSRLWCVLELFVFLEMNIDNDDFEVRMLGDKAAVASIAQNFHIEYAQCYDVETTEMLMGVIDAGGADMRKKLVSFVKDRFQQD